MLPTVLVHPGRSNLPPLGVVKKRRDTLTPSPRLDRIRNFFAYMAYPQASHISLTPRQQLILEQIVRRPTSSQGLVKRVRLILAAAEGINKLFHI
jgi:hypothetical protein